MCTFFKQAYNKYLSNTHDMIAGVLQTTGHYPLMCSEMNGLKTAF